MRTGKVIVLNPAYGPEVDACLSPLRIIMTARESLRNGLFILTSSLIVLIALRNSLQWHLERFWGASGSRFSTLWAYIYRLHGENDFVMWVPALSNAVFILANVFFTLVDLTAKPSFILQYKIQQDKNVPVNWVRYKKVLMLVLFNSTVVSTVYSCATYQLVMWRGNSCGYELPSFPTTVVHFLGFFVCAEIGLYYMHRLFHHRLIYKHIHKIHHEWTAPIGLVAIYGHPLEHMFVNLLPVSLGPLVMGSHLSVVWLWYTLAITNTTITHSGYHLPLMPSPEAHDFHHLKFNWNYGVLGVLDRLHGTDRLFRENEAYKRHNVLLGLTPARQLVPDVAKTPPQGKQ